MEMDKVTQEEMDKLADKHGEKSKEGTMLQNRNTSFSTICLMTTGFPPAPTLAHLTRDGLRRLLEDPRIEQDENGVLYK